MKILVLDIDGVLNRLNGKLLFEPECVQHLNQILSVTEAKIVVSSSWRYLLFDTDDEEKAMTHRGFAFMLRTHGIMGVEIIGHLLSEEWHDAEVTRGQLTRHWLREHRSLNIERYVCLDDTDDGFTSESLPFVQTDGNKGLTAESAADVIRMF